MDIHKNKIDACIRIGDGSAEGEVIIRTFPTMRKSLYDLRDWLLSLGCFKVLMESTGVFWMPIYWLLESVLSDITGTSGRKILARLARDGSLNVSDIREEIQGTCRHTPEEIECAINGIMKHSSQILLKLHLNKLEAGDRELDEVYSHMPLLAKDYEPAIRI